MNTMLTVSVAMAVCNGEAYLRPQLDSILPQLMPEDELIISLNPSQDRSLQIIETYTAKDSRIRLFHCNETGVISNFDNVLNHCRGDLICLSDQDDVWMENKLSFLRSQMADSALSGVVHGCVFVDEQLTPLSEQPILIDHDIRALEILWKNPVRGCCLCLRRFPLLFKLLAKNLQLRQQPFHIGHVQPIGLLDPVLQLL